MNLKPQRAWKKTLSGKTPPESEKNLKEEMSLPGKKALATHLPEGSFLPKKKENSG